MALVLLILAVAVLAAWLMSHGWTMPGLALAGALVVCAAVWRRSRTRVSLTRRLRWDGQSWRLLTGFGVQDEGPAGTVCTVLDLGDGLLLRWVAGGGGEACLLPLWRGRDQGPAWHALRVAVRATRVPP
jgi:hypothetical protein